MSRIDRVIRRNKRRKDIEAIAKLIAVNAADYESYKGKAEKVVKYFESKIKLP